MTSRLPLRLAYGKTIMLLLGIVAATYLGLCAWLYATQRGQIYYPTPEVHLPGTEVLWIESEGERIKVWAVPRTGSRALLYFGGNADDVAAHIDLFATAVPEYSLYLVNYRGYGGSSGRPSESGLVTDALAVYDHVQKMHGDIAVVGRSLGSGVAVQLASERPVSKLVLVTPFDSLVNLAKTYFRWLPVGWLLLDRYDSAGKASAVNASVLVLIAGEDEIVPRIRSQALAKSFHPRQVQVTVVRGVGHNTLDLSPEYLASVRMFLTTP